MRRTTSPLLLLAILLALPGPGLGASDEVPFVEEFSGRIGLLAVTVDPDAEAFAPLESVTLAPDESFPLASTFKLAVLYEVLRAIDEGDLRWRQNLRIRPRDRSLDFERRRRMRVARLARKMIRDSHNTSTDVLLKAVGLGAPTETLEAWELEGMRILMPTREFWLALSGLVPELFPEEGMVTAAQAFAAADREEQLEIVEDLRRRGSRFSPGRIERESNDFYAFEDLTREESFEVLDDVDNVATPEQVVRLLHRMFFDSHLSRRSRRRMRRPLRRGDRAIDRRSISVPLAYWGGKGGDDLGMASVAGYGETRRGNHVLYAILGSHMVRETRDARIIEELLGWAFDILDRGPTSRPVPAAGTE